MSKHLREIFEKNVTSVLWSTCCEGQKAGKTAGQGDGGADAALYNEVLDHHVIQSQIEVYCSCDTVYVFNYI